MSKKKDTGRLVPRIAALGCLLWAAAVFAASPPPLKPDEAVRCILPGPCEFQIDVPEIAERLEFQIAAAGSARASLWVKRGRAPDLKRDSADLSWSGEAGERLLQITRNSSPPLSKGTYFIAVASSAADAQGTVEFLARVGGPRVRPADPKPGSDPMPNSDAKPGVLSWLPVALAALSVVMLAFLCWQVRRLSSRLDAEKEEFGEAGQDPAEIARLLRRIDAKLIVLAERSAQPEESQDEPEPTAAEGERRRAEAASRLDEIEREDVYALAGAAREVISALGKTAAAEYGDAFESYVSIPRKLGELRKKLASAETPPEEAELREFTDEIARLRDKHNPRYFLNLLDAARRAAVPGLGRLLELLGIEEYGVAPETEVWRLEEYEIVRVNGSGYRTYVEEIEGNGYRLKRNGEVLRKPRISVRKSAEARPGTA
ncbi:MAG: hypothetical protein Q8N47_27610 [Bryobacterales bacterium]|nr:hypothetical protein [Bryobacterales bacterium]